MDIRGSHTCDGRVAHDRSFSGLDSITGAGDTARLLTASGMMGADMIRTRGLTHLALRVRDAERAFAFYEQVFGMVAVYRGPGFVQAQTPGAWDVIVFEEPYETAGGSGGINHFGFRLIDPHGIDEAALAVQAAGGQIVSRGEFVPGEPYLFCRDPDGHDLEIWYELPTSADPAHSRRSPDD